MAHFLSSYARLRTAWVLALVVVSVLLVDTSSASAASWTGTVSHVADGDTLDVLVGGTENRVRMIGINAMELGECHADTAHRRLRRLVEGKKVTLKAEDPNSTGNGRLLRYVELNGTDIGEVLLDEGLVIAFPNGQEPARNERYQRAARAAAASGLGVWNRTACGYGPQQSAPIDLYVKWDADGNDYDNVNGEWARITNKGSVALNLGGWRFRDSSTFHRYTFPKGTSVPAGGSIYLHVGKGTDTNKRLYWGLSKPIFGSIGDGGYLIDPHGDIRAHYVWPCLDDCKDPIGAAIDLSANIDAVGYDTENPNGEWVNIRNISSSPLDLEGYVVQSPPYSFQLRGNTVIKPGERLRIYVGKGTNSRLVRYWGEPDGILNNSGGETVVIKSPSGKLAKRFDYFCTTCPLPDVAVTHVNYDAEGNDTTNPNGEWIVIRNRDDDPVDLIDWKIDAGGGKHYHFASNRVLSPGQKLTLKIGKGTDSSSTVHWGSGSGMLNNRKGNVVLLSRYRDPSGCKAWGGAACPPRPGRPHPPSESAGRIFDHWTVPQWNDQTSHPFRDVGKVWQRKPVGWLYSNDITYGKTKTSYAPDDKVTRGQMAAFLWRLAGEPKVSEPHGFVDIDSAWQQAPVRWLKASGITQGVDARHFAPDRAVTRGQMAAFMWRLVDEPGRNPDHGFSDIESAWQQEPVRWLKYWGVTQGISDTKYGPDQRVTRGQMAAFLYRLAQRL